MEHLGANLNAIVGTERVEAKLFQQRARNAGEHLAVGISLQ